MSKMFLEDLLVEAEAQRRGLRTTRIPKGQSSRVSVTNGRRTFLFWGGGCSKNSPLGHRVSLNKQAAKSMMQVAGGEVLPGQIFDSSEVDAARRYANYLGYPVVAKPNGSGGGRGVIPNIMNEAEFTESLARIARNFSRILVEKHMDAEEYRVLVVGKEVVGVVNRIPAHVVGNGISSIGNLIRDKNVLRTQNEAHKPIRLDAELHRVLGGQGLSLESVPSAETHVLLRFNSNVSSGGEAKDCTDDIHPEYKKILVDAARSMRLFICGFDVLARNISASPQRGEWAIIEANSTPMHSLHSHPWIGRPRNVSGIVLDNLFPETAGGSGGSTTQLGEMPSQ